MTTDNLSTRHLRRRWQAKRLCLLLAVLVWGCSAEPYVPELPADHPASPEAPISAYEMPPDELVEPLTNEPASGDPDTPMDGNDDDEEP